MIIDDNKKPILNYKEPSCLEKTGLERAAAKQIRKYAQEIEGCDSELTLSLKNHKLSGIPSIFMRKSETGLPYSFQVFLDDNEQIKIVVHTKKIVGKETFKTIRSSYLINLTNDKIIECVKATPNFFSPERVKKENEKMINEFKALFQLKGKPGIIQLINCCAYTKKESNYDKINLILQKGECDLEIAMTNRMTVTSDMLFDLAEGVDAIHSLGKVHGDLKLSNIVAMSNGELRIIDFGSFHDALDSKRLGTRSYHSPAMNRYIELFCNLKTTGSINTRDWEEEKRLTKIVGQANDIFGLGIIFYFCLTTSVLPWWDNLDNQIDPKHLEKLAEACRHNCIVIQKGYKKLVAEQWPESSRTPLQQLIIEMLNPNDYTRIKSGEVLLRLEQIFES